MSRHETKIKQKACAHDNLTNYGNYTGVVITVDDRLDMGPSMVEGIFTYKKYKCVDCGRIITVLNAVVEKSEEKKMTVTGKTVKHCHGKSKGKVIKKHKTHAAAVKQHRAIQVDK